MGSVDDFPKRFWHQPVTYTNENGETWMSQRCVTSELPMSSSSSKYNGMSCILVKAQGLHVPFMMCLPCSSDLLDLVHEGASGQIEKRPSGGSRYYISSMMVILMLWLWVLCGLRQMQWIASCPPKTSKLIWLSNKTSVKGSKRILLR